MGALQAPVTRAELRRMQEPIGLVEAFRIAWRHRPLRDALRIHVCTMIRGVS